MQEEKNESSEQLFSTEAINVQVQKIVTDRVFENSTILKNFLQYVVEQSLQGNSNQLKEYTIAINVLRKPVEFNTQENGIVRIHAARLRRILDLYYKDRGQIDNIRISIPKGNYIPHFSKNNGHQLNGIGFKEPIVIGIIPFNQLGGSEAENSVLKGIELQLAAALMKFENFFVVGFQMISDLFKKDHDIKKLINDYDLNYMIMGEASVVKKNVRLYVHLIKSRSNQQVWAQMYERKIVNNNYFEIQDDVVNMILMHLSEYFI